MGTKNNMAATIDKDKFTGIVIRQDLYKEDALKITFLTEHGLGSLIVRGARKIESKLKILTPVITKIECMASTGRILNTLTEGVVLENYTDIKENPLKTSIALALFENILTFIDTISDYKVLYHFLEQMLQLLSKSDYPMSILTIFNIKMWYLVGSQPDFKACPVCGKTGIYFSVASGGMLCKAHHNAASVGAELSKLIKLIYLIKLEKIDEELLKFINQYYAELLPIIKDYYQTYFDYTNRYLKIIEMMLD